MSAPSPSGQQRRGLRNDQVAGLFILALAVFIGWQNRVYPLGSLAEPGPGYVPLLLAIALGATGLAIAALGGRSAPLADTRWHEARRAVLILVACAAATFALERIGYRLTVLALLVFFLGVVERRSPVMVGVVAVGFSLASHYVVGVMLKVPLPRGPWGF